MWKEISGMPKYRINEAGQVFNNNSGKTLADHKHTKGYRAVSLYINGKHKLQLIHRLVATAFIPNPNNKPFVHHIDGNKTNNHVSNLEWVTNTENMRYAVNGNNTHYKLSFKDAERIRKLYKSGKKALDIATEYNISRSHTYAIIYKWYLAKP